MAKKSGRAKGKRAARKSIGAFMAGDQVRVLHGDYGNAAGSVVRSEGTKVLVLLGKLEVWHDAHNLVHGGPKDRV